MRTSILVVDDNRALAENLAELFEEIGEVRIASTAGEALTQIRQYPTDLAIVDVRLPEERSGVDLVPALRASSPGGEVILVTGNATLDTAIAAVRHGVFAYVQKPFEPADLLALAERALSQVQLRKERLELESRAAEAEAMAALGRLTAALAHEIRNPLNAAMLQLELMQRAAARSSDESMHKGVEDRVRVVKADLGRLSRLLDEFLGLARPRHFEQAQIDVTAMVEEIRTLQEPVLATQGVTLQVEVQAGLPDITGDEGRIRQVLVNLIVNASDALEGRGGTVLLAAKLGADERAVELVVEDDGPGIPEEIRAKLFRAFVTGKAKGTGLGLAIVKQLVELHGGRVSLDPREGGGTRAVVLLPARYQSSPSLSSSSSS